MTKPTQAYQDTLVVLLMKQLSLEAKIKSRNVIKPHSIGMYFVAEKIVMTPNMI